jgi:hypothetical protein
VMKAHILGFIFLTGFAPAAPAQRNEQSRLPIIDVHVHAYAKDERWVFKVPNPRSGQPMTATTEARSCICIHRCTPIWVCSIGADRERNFTSTCEPWCVQGSESA